MEAALTDTSYAASNVLAGVDDPNGSPLTFDSSATGIGQAFPFNSSQQDLFLDCAGWNDTTTEVQLGDTPTPEAPSSIFSSYSAAWVMR